MRAALRTDVTNVLGHRMHLDATDRGELSIHGIYEPLTTDLVRAKITPGDVVLDIGANIGYYTLIFAKCVGPRGAWSPSSRSRGTSISCKTTCGQRLPQCLSRSSCGVGPGRARAIVPGCRQRRRLPDVRLAR